MSTRVTDNKDGTISVALKYPVEHAKRKISEIVLRTECTVADLEAMDSGKGDVDKTKRLICELAQSSSASIPLAVISKLRPVDYFLLAKEVGKIISGEDEQLEEETSDEGK
jgi:hypothetical protein